MTPPGPPRPPRFRWSRVPSIAYHLLLAAAVLALGAMIVWRPLLGRCDFWAHAAVGRWVCENGTAPDRSLFLWTADEPWVYHSWLSQVVFYALARLGGSDASAPAVALGFTVVLALAPFALAWWVWAARTRPTCWMAVPFVLALEGVAPRLETRPELFTAAFLSGLLAWLALRTAPAPGAPRRRVGALGLALLGFVVWANLHGAVVLGVQVLAVTAVCDFLQNRRDGRWKVPARLAALAPLAVCVNPYGPHYWAALEPVGSSRFAEILEWFPLWKGPPLPAEMVLAATVLPGLAVAAWALNRERRWAQLAWLLMFAAMFALARRNIWPFSLASLLVLAANAKSLDPEALWGWLSRRTVAPPLPPVLRWAARAFVLGWVLLHLGPVYLYLRPWRNHGPARLETGIVRFVNAAQLRGRVFNDYENSSYMQWAFAGRPALFIDLLNAYPDTVMRDYRDLVTLTDRGVGLLDEKGIEVVILTTERGGAVSLAKLADHLDELPEWVRVYAGGDGVVWVRRTPAFERVWGPVKGTVKLTSFATLERFSEEAGALSAPTIPEKWR